ncbi:cell death regulator Aven isoform X2 [Dromaius novaehollandiae]|uniref:Apoptosis and caspase activation inhibitor n=1 Tax=Dromaius novaehollandiae TaxID=8790 RepID=A0A8C4J8S4_DRONO|nr:cell death regulator Aven [Dromaius novaehollandiae]
MKAGCRFTCLYATVEDDDDNESREEEEKEDLKSYSRRKIVSNWSRYEDAEKEGQNESAESQRGTDFSVLLSSAGDSFTHFRFAEEKEWDTESICHEQLSALSVDCQILVQALQEVPLHLRLNVAAELVQASTPAELPHVKFKNIEDDSNRREILFQQSLAQSETVSISHHVGDSVAPSEPRSKDTHAANAAEPFQKGLPLSKQETDHLDEELDLLLSLDAPVNAENRCVSGALSYNVTEKDQKMDYKEKDPLKLDVPEEKSTASQQQQSTSKNVTEEELEDWLDSMIS